MAISRYDKPAEQRLINTYVPLPFKELSGALAYKQAKQDQEVQSASILGQTTPALPQDVPYAQKLDTYYQNKLDDLQNQDLTSQEGQNELHNIRKEFQSDATYGQKAAITNRYNAYQGYKKSIEEDKNMPDSQKQYLLNRLNQETIQTPLQNPETGEYNGIPAPQLFTWVDKDKFTQDVIKGIKEDSRYSGLIPTSVANLPEFERAYREGKVSEVTYNKVLGTLANVYAGNPDLMRTVQAQASLEGRDPNQELQFIQKDNKGRYRWNPNTILGSTGAGYTTGAIYKQEDFDTTFRKDDAGYYAWQKQYDKTIADSERQVENLPSINVPMTDTQGISDLLGGAVGINPYGGITYVSKPDRQSTTPITVNQASIIKQANSQSQNLPKNPDGSIRELSDKEYTEWFNSLSPKDRQTMLNNTKNYIDNFGKISFNPSILTYGPDQQKEQNDYLIKGKNLNSRSARLLGGEDVLNLGTSEVKGADLLAKINQEGYTASVRGDLDADNPYYPGAQVVEINDKSGNIVGTYVISGNKNAQSRDLLRYDWNSSRYKGVGNETTIKVGGKDVPIRTETVYDAIGTDVSPSGQTTTDDVSRDARNSQKSRVMTKQGTRWVPVDHITINTPSGEIEIPTENGYINQQQSQQYGFNSPLDLLNYSVFGGQ